MVRQVDILKLDFNPQIGHEQVGYMTIVCPITNTQRPFPLHIPLDDRTKTTGVVLCEHIKALDLNSRTYKIIERVPDDILEEIIATVFSQIEK